MKILTYGCLRCGWCCTHLLARTDLGLLGLYLQEKERRLFPEEHVFPMYGCGEAKGVSRPRPPRIFAWQLALNVCPHYQPASASCAYYSQRPNICRGFPFDILMASASCTFIKRYAPSDEPYTIDPSTRQVEINANKLHLLYVSQFKPLEPLWIWPLDKHCWIKRTEKDKKRLISGVPRLQELLETNRK